MKGYGRRKEASIYSSRYVFDEILPILTREMDWFLRFLQL